MTITQTPLEKTLLNLDLSKGVDERSRPELIGTAANITKLENLVQDQTGAWVKRPGLQLGYTAEDTSFYPTAVRKILNLPTGWGVIGNGGKLLHKQDTQAGFAARQSVMDFGVQSARFSGSSGPQATDGAFGAGVLAATGSSRHDAFVIRGLTTFPYGYSERLVISERATGVEYSYDLSKVVTSGQSRAMCFVADRYLHLFVSGGGDINVIVIDTLTTIPATWQALASGHVHLVASYGSGRVVDCVGGTTQSYVSVYDAGTLTPHIMAIDPSTGAVNATFTGAGSQYAYLAVNDTLSTLFYSNGGQVSGLNTTTMAASVAAFGPPAITGFCVDSASKMYAVQKTTAAVGGTTVDIIKSYSCPAGGGYTLVGACYGWTPVSAPFYCSGADKAYMHVVKSDPTAASTVSSHAIMDITTFVGLYSNTAGLALPFGAFRIACQLEPFNGYRLTGVDAGYGSGQAHQFHYACDDGYTFTVCVPYLAAARTAGIGMLRCALLDSTAFGSANFSGSAYLAHGGLNSYDGANLVEQGFADLPIVDKVTPGATAGNLNGSYRYVAVYRHVDSNGVSSYSRTCNPVFATNVAASTGKNNITIPPPGLTNRDSGHGESAPVIDLYRTLNGGTIYYLCATSQQNVSATTTQQLAVNATTGLFTVTDNLSDSSLSSLAVMYRQPGTPGAPADRYAAPATKILCQHKDRLFCADPYGQRVYYSSFFVDGEAAWFNPAFSFYVHDGSGPITALASMDGRLFVFKRDQVFVVDGDGPGEMGPTGNEFSPPQALASRFGCIDHRSVVVTPDGIMYRSSRGFELITRSLQVKWIGDRVWATASAFPITTSACLDSAGRVHILCAEDEGALGVYAQMGVELVYDMTNDSWSTGKYTDALSRYGGAKSCCAEVKDNGRYVMAYSDNYIGVGMAGAAHMDVYSAAYVPFTVETGWMKQGPQARQRVSDVLFLGLKDPDSNHALTISHAYDYVNTYTQTNTWEPNIINVAKIEELDLQPKEEQVLAIRTKIQDQAPADTGTYPIGTGKGCDVLSITAEVAPKVGAPKLPAGQKA